jgi:prepilin-type N-terminal cleavage/methylation domain-containing protein
MKKKVRHIMLRKHTHGFTLVELLVVISIIAVLLSILMPALNKVRDQARRTTCTTNIRQQGIAMVAYASENRNKYPAAPAPGWWPFGGLANWTVANGTPSWASGTYVPAGQMALFLKKYLISPEVFYCPSARVNRTYISKEEHWDAPAKKYSSEKYLGFRCYSSYSSYATWAGYGYDASGVFFDTLWETEEEKNLFINRTAHNTLSRSNTVVLSDIILADYGAYAQTWNNHCRAGKSLGGSVQYNDGSAKWVDFSKTQIMIKNATRNFHFHF